MSAEAQAYFDALPRYCMAAVQTAYDKIGSGHYSDAGIYRGLCKDFDEVGQKHPDRKLFNVWFAAVEKGEAERPARHIDEASSAGNPAPKEKTERVHRQRTSTSSAPSVVASAEAVDKAALETVGTPAALEAATSEVLDHLGVKPVAGDPITARPFLEPAFRGVQIAPVINDAEAVLDALAAELNETPFQLAPPDLQVSGPPAFVAVQAAAGRLLEEVIIQMTRDIEKSARETTARMLRDVADELEGGVV